MSLSRVPCTSMTVTSKAANYSMTPADDIILVSAVATITLPDAATVTHKIVHVKGTGTGYVVTVDTNGENLDGIASQELGEYEGISVASDGTDWWVV